jgi:hypothetical protein
VTPQKIYATIIVRQVVVVEGEVSSRLGVLLGFSPISLHDLFCAICDGFRF